MEKYFRFLLPAIFILGLLALSGKGVSGQTSATETNNTASTSNADTPSNDTSVDDVTSPNVTSTDDSAPPIDTDESDHQAPEKADFVVYNSMGKPCLLASINISMHFKYRVQERLVRETYDTVSKENTQDGSRYWGMCEETMSKLSITWNNDTFTLNLTFILKDKKDGYSNEIDMDVLPPGVNSSDHSWSLQEVSLSYDTANEAMFPGAINPTVESVVAGDLNLFKTPLGMSYMCKVPEVVTVEFKDVDLAFNYVHLMPFGVQSHFFSNETVECSGDMSSVPAKDESYTVPLIVAGVLAGIVVAILVVYATVRCVTRRVRQADYKQME